MTTGLTVIVDGTLPNTPMWIDRPKGYYVYRGGSLAGASRSGISCNCDFNDCCNVSEMTTEEVDHLVDWVFSGTMALLHNNLFNDITPSQQRHSLDNANIDMTVNRVFGTVHDAFM